MKIILATILSILLIGCAPTGGPGDIWVEKAGDIMSGDLTFATTEGPVIRNVGGNIANPAFSPDKNFNQSGIGTGGGGYISIIVNGREKTEWLDNGLMSHFGGDITINTANAKIFGSQSAAAALLNEIASATNPTLVSNRGDVDTGIGSAAANQLSLIAGAAEGVRVDTDETEGNTRFLVYDVDNATLERVTVGPADSGGTGFKVLRIPN